MTENERLTIDEIIQHCNRTCENTEMFAIARGQNQEDITSKGYWEHYQVANYLEELKQYRAIGTVECYEKAIQSSMEYYNLMKEYKAKVDELEAIGTVEEFKALKEIMSHLLCRHLHQTIELYGKEECVNDLEPILLSFGISSEVLDRYRV